MPEVLYEVVEHDSGWAYKLGDAFSETYPSREAAIEAAQAAAARQELPRTTGEILYQDENGQWHQELARGNDTPHADVIA